MNLSFQIARRYLFGKKSTNAINLITGISVLGIAIGTAALILVLSVFNGFEVLTLKHLDTFNPDYKIIPREGKFFSIEPDKLNGLENLTAINNHSKVLEEVAHLEYNSRQQIGIIKGVDTQFLDVTDLSEAIKEGEAFFGNDESGFYAVVGNGVYNILNINLSSKIESLRISVPNRRKKGPLDRDFKTRSFLGSGVFSIRNERDNQYVLVDYNIASNLLDLKNQVSAIEIKSNEGFESKEVKRQIATIFPESHFQIMDRIEQDASILKVMNIEKWSSYLIFSFTLVLIVFNVIGSLWMIVLEKKKDIAILRSLGATKKLVKNIFLLEGGMISILGFLIGFILSLIFYVLQKTVGIISVPDGFSITNYPVEMEWLDVIVIMATVLTLGIIASIPAALKASRGSAYVRIE